ncbi:MAG: MATE family efflux transporter [Pseudoxanthomonas suwonensis]|nr:MATE family efflux transporter [Pseudoxanthomonas suwonensis]
MDDESRPLATAGNARDLTRGPVGGTLLLFALPILASNVLQSLNGSVNAIWVGRFLGEAALAAVANANNIMFFLLGAVFGVGMAATILVAQAIGRNDLLGAKQAIGTSLSFFVGVSVVIALLGFPLSRHILAWMGTPAEALPLAESYLRIIFIAMPAMYLFALLTAILRGSGDTRTPFWFLLLVVALDVILVPLLMFGVGPLPRMGIAGAAMATLICNVVGLAAMLAWLRHRDHPLWLDASERHYLRPDPRILKALVIKGVPMGLQMVLVSLAMLMMISLVNRQGLAWTSAYAATLQLWNYVQMPAMAIGAACSSMAAQNVGAGRWDRVDATARTGILFNVLLTGSLIAPTVLLAHHSLGLFLPADSIALEHANHLNRIAVWSFLFFGVTFVISGVVRSTGAVLVPLLILAAALWGVRIPFALALQPVLGVDAIWWSFPVSALCAMLLSLAYYRWGRWREARMLADRRTEGEPDEETVDSIALPATVQTASTSAVADCCPRTTPHRHLADGRVVPVTD